MKMNFITLWKLNDWGFYNRRDEALLRELSRRDNVESVLHIEFVGLKALIRMVKKWFHTKDSAFRQAYNYHIRKGFSLKPISVDKEKKYFIYSMIIIYSRNNPFLRKISNLFMKIQYGAINRYFVKTRENVVCIAYPPSDYLQEAIGAIRHDLLIADFEDDTLERVGDVLTKKRIEDNYRAVLPGCKWIFSTSPDINRKYKGLAKQAIDCLPNGVDSKFFQDYSGHKTRHKTGRKVAGYVGAINKTIDVDLLEYVVSRFPETDFVLVGFATIEQLRNISRMSEKYANFRFLGEKNYKDIPIFTETLDVLISLKKNDSTTAGGDSQKIYEYLATGKPIVTTPVPPAERYKDVMYVAHNKEEFAEYLKLALAEDAPEKSKMRVEIARENSWEKRVDVILEKVVGIFSPQGISI